MSGHGEHITDPSIPSPATTRTNTSSNNARDASSAALRAVRETQRREQREQNESGPAGAVARAETAEQQQQPLFVSYVTGSAAGTGRWETRVNLDLERSAAVSPSSGSRPATTAPANPNTSTSRATATNVPDNQPEPSTNTITLETSATTAARINAARQEPWRLNWRNQALPRNHTRTTAEIYGVSPAEVEELREIYLQRVSASEATPYVPPSVQQQRQWVEEYQAGLLQEEREARRAEERSMPPAHSARSTGLTATSAATATATATPTAAPTAEKKDTSSSSTAAMQAQGKHGGAPSSGGVDDPARVTLRQLWNLAQSARTGRTAAAPSSSTIDAGKNTAANSTSNNNISATAGGPATHQRWTEEQLFKGLVVDYLSHAGYPGTVGVLLGLGGPEVETGPSIAGRVAKPEEDDVHMLSASTTMQTIDTGNRDENVSVNGSGAGMKSLNGGTGKGKFDARLFVKQIEWRKEIRQLIISGRISDATALVRRHFPDVLDTSRDAYRARTSGGGGSSGSARSVETSGAGLPRGGGAAEDEDEDMEHDDDAHEVTRDRFGARDLYEIGDHEEDEDEEEEDEDGDDDEDDEEANDAATIGGGYVFGRTPIPTPMPGPFSTSMAIAGPRQRLLPSAGNGFSGGSATTAATPIATNNNNNNGSSSRSLAESRQPRYGAGGFPVPAPGGSTNANAARGGTGSRFGMMTSGGSGGGGTGGGAGARSSNGLGAAASAGSLGGGSGDVQWTVHPRTTSTMTTAGIQSGTVTTLPSSSSGVTSTSHTSSSDPHHLMAGGMLRIPAFPYARTYDRPTLLALNLDIQEFVEGLRVLQQQVPSSPSEAVSLAGSMYDETTSHAAGGSTNGSGTATEVISGATKTLRTTMSEHDQPMTSRPATPNANANPSLSGTAARKAARDAAILACLSHAARLDSATQHLRPRESRRYAQQVQDVCGLLAYNDMDASPLAGYLEQERRVGLADMVEGCIMASTGYSAQSVLESLWQQDAYLWHPEQGHLALNDVTFSDTDGVESEEGKRMRELASDLLYYQRLTGLS